jgi:hypothetical protein
VWLLPASAGATLVTYDRNIDRLLVRELPYPSPLSAPQAAEAARMVRTTLRALRVAHESEQLPAPVAIVAPPPPPPPPPPPWLGISIGGGAWFSAPAETSTLAGSVTAVWRPHGLGIALTGAFAGEARVMTPVFVGHVRDVPAAVEARKAFELLPRLRLAPGAGLAWHAISLRGELVDGAAVESRSYNPAIRVGATGLYSLPRNVDVGFAVSVDCLLVRQRYEAGTQEFLTIPRMQVLTHFIVGVRL